MAWSDEARAAAAATRKAKSKHPAKGQKVTSALSKVHVAKISLVNVKSVLKDPTRMAKSWKPNARPTPAVAAMSGGGIKRAGNFWGLRHK